MAKDPGSNIFSAFNLGTLTAPKVLRDAIGGKDRFDFYKFNLKGADSFNFRSTLKQLRKNADLAILDSKGRVIYSSREPGRQSEAIAGVLDAGSYYVRVRGTKPTPFKLRLAATPVPPPPQDLDGTFDTATNLGTLTSSLTASSSIGTVEAQGRDEQDYFRFAIAETKNLSAAIAGLTQNANLELFNSSFQSIGTAALDGTATDTVNLSNLAAGTYYARVVPGDAAATTNYTLSLTATAPPPPPVDANGTFAAATNLGTIASTLTISDAIGRTEPHGRDENDYFRFAINNPKNLTATVSGLTQDANLILYDGTLQAIGSATLPGSATDTVNLDGLAAGTYYARVVPGDGTANTAYALSLTATNLPSPPDNTDPRLSTNPATLGRGTELVIGSDRLLATDAEQTAGQLGYTLDSLPANGTLFLNGVKLTESSSFTQADVNSGGLKYVSLAGEVALGAGALVDVLEVDGSNVFFTERDAFGTATLKFKDFSTGRTETLSNNLLYRVEDSVLKLSQGGIDGSSIVWSDGIDLFYFNAASSSAPVNITDQLSTEFQLSGLHNFYDIDGTNVIFESRDSSDYELFLFQGASGTLERLTDNAEDDFQMAIGGNHIAWSSRVTGSFYDAFLYEISDGNPIQNAVNLTTTNLLGAADSDAWVKGISGSNVVFSNELGSSSTSELFFSNGTANGVTRLTTNSVADVFHGISDSTVFWTTGGVSTSGSSEDLEIVVQTVGSAAIRTQNSVDDVFQGIDGSSIVWSATDADGFDRLFLRSGTGAVVELTRNQTVRSGNEDFLGISGTNVVWEAQAGGADQLFFRDAASGSARQITSITNGGFPVFGELSDSTLLYSVGNSIFVADGSGGAPTLVSSSGGTFNGFAQVSGANVAWTRPGGTLGEEALFGNFAVADSFSVTVTDGAGGSAAGTYSLTIG